MYQFLKILSKFFSILPRSFSLQVGKQLGQIFYFLSSKKKAQALKNVRLVFPEKSFSEVLNIVKESFKNFGMSLIETLRVPEDAEFLRKNLIIEDKDLFKSLKSGSSILCGIHSGSWEVANSCLGGQFNYVIIAKKQKLTSWDRFLNELRKSFGLEVVYEDDLRSLIDFLKKGYVLGLVFDHGSGDSQFYSSFFGKVLPTPIGALKLACKFKRKIFPGVIKREGLSFRLEISKPLRVEKKEEFPQKAEILNNYFENFLKKHPFEYLWWYKRFKRAKNLNILVLSDGKPGHTKQSLSLAKLIAEKRRGSFIEVVKLELSKFQRFWLNVVFLFSCPKCFGCFRCLRVILGKDLERVFKYADVIISCGASLSSLNRILAYNLSCKSFIIQKPCLGLKKFDLVVLPSHDRVKNFKNVVRIKGSLNFFQEEEVKDSREKLKSICPGVREDLPKIGVFIGGPLNKNFNKNLSLEFLKTLKEKSFKNNWQLFVTTSRRTPYFLEEFLEKEFKDISLLIIANKKNYPFVSLGIISLCDLILVSSDSVSMITEASSLKPTLVFSLFGVKDKQRRFVEDISSEGYTQVITKENLEKTLKGVLTKDISLKNIDNKETVEKIINSKL